MSSAALRVSLIYALVSAAWILLSDQVLARLAPSVQAMTVMQTLKGWAFVVVSAAIIYLLVLREFVSQRRAEHWERQAEVRVRQAADQVYAMIRNSPLGVVILGSDRRVMLWNPGAEQIFGWSAEEVIGRPPPFVPDDRREEFLQYVQRALEGNLLAGEEIVRQRKDGRAVHLRMWTSPLRDEDDRITALFAMFEDVTLQRETEAFLRRRAEQLAGLHQTSLDLSAQMDLEPLLRTIVERAARLIGARMGGVFLTTSDGTMLEQVIDYGRTEEFLGVRLRMGEGVSGVAAERGAPFMVENHRTWAHKSSAFKDSSAGRVLGVPLITQGKTLGVLYLSDETEGRFSDDEVQLAVLFAEQAAIAIHNARLFDETRRQGEQMEALYQTAVEITAQTDLDQLLAAIVDRAVVLLGLPVGGLYLLNEVSQTLELVVSRYPDHDYTGTQLAIGEGVAGRAFARGEPFAVESYADWDGKAAVYDDVRLGRVLAVPLRAGGRATGSLYVSDFERGQFTPADTRLVSLFADQAGVAIENSRLLRSERQRTAELMRSQALIESLSHLAAKLERSTRPEELLDTLRAELQALGIRCWLGVIDEQTQMLSTRFLAGGTSALADAETSLLQATRDLSIRPTDIPLFRELLGGGKPALVSGAEIVKQVVPSELQGPFADSIMAAAMAQPDTPAIALPLVRSEQPIGLFILWGNTLHPGDVAALSVFGSQVSVALEKAQLLDETRRRAAYLGTLRDMALALRQAPDRDSMRPIILGQLQGLLAGQAAWLAWRDPLSGETEVVLATGEWASTTGMRLRPGEGIAGRVIATGQAEIHDDVRGDPHLARADLVRDIPAMACVPLTVQNETQGCLTIGRRIPFGEDDVRLLTAIADTAGSALHRAGVMETLEARVAQRTHELEQANARLQELDRLKTEFVSNVTHELRTPITNVLLYLDLLRVSPSPEKSAHYLRVLKTESSRLGRLIEDLLTLSRLERGVVPLESEPHPLDALLAEVLVALTPSAQARGVELRHEPNPALPVASVNRSQIQQVFTNLVGNAIAYARPAGLVRLSTGRRVLGERAFVGVTIFNDGPPIDAEDLPHIFERFYRGRTAKESGQPGTGLGLAISREIVERHTGWIEVETGVDGTAFTVWLPAGRPS